MKNLNWLRFVLVVTGFLSISAPARAELLITPMLVVMKQTDRFATVTLVNTADGVRSYDISLTYNRMQETGVPYAASATSVTDFDLGKHMTYTPRRISLAPGAKQKIRLAVRPGAEMPPPGDYRVHLQFSSIPTDKSASQETAGGKQIGEESKVNAAVRVYLGFTIPIIWRVGESDATAKIESISLEAGAKGTMNMYVDTIREGGPYSVLGYLYVYHTPVGGREELVGEISNANIFPEVNRRRMMVGLKKQVGPGMFRLVLKTGGTEQDTVIAERQFPVK